MKKIEINVWKITAPVLIPFNLLLDFHTEKFPRNVAQDNRRQKEKENAMGKYRLKGLADSECLIE